jgi:hypothetical protein
MLGRLQRRLRYARIIDASRSVRLILIVSLRNDLHALAICREIRTRGICECHIIESDRIAQKTSVSLRVAHEIAPAAFCRTFENKWIDIAAAKVLWLRRPRGSQILDCPIEDQTALALINNDCGGALRGLLSSGFTGRWISTFEALSRGSDKIYQLYAASLSGFRVPNTIVTQSVDELNNFFIENQRNIIVKTIVGAEGPFLLTRKISDLEAFERASYEAAPAIYQECIPGTRHIRLVCFGDQSVAACIETSELDWRPDLNVPITPWNVAPEIHRLVRRTLDFLGLEMGIIDLKETPQGEIVWFEVNPQGQFLFLDALTELRLASKFADYLIDAAAST